MNSQFTKDCIINVLSGEKMMNNEQIMHIIEEEVDKYTL